MKKICITLAFALGILAFTPSADAGYRRTVVGYDSRGNAIIRVVWVADHLDYPRTIYDRRTYPTSLRRDPESYTDNPLPSLPGYRVYPVYDPAYSAYRPELEVRNE
jgi:hypothetical protein